ncbi:MAG: glycosyltransferase family 1 protein, partial [Ilumatobacteraceae bacterium]
MRQGDEGQRIINVAFDVGPLAGRRTGIGAAVGALRAELEREPSIRLLPYLTSFRAPRDGEVRRLPLPAMAAHRLWAHIDRPRADRWLGGADVVHGTNYVVPPTTAPRLVSVYDCWFLAHERQAHPDVVRAGRVLLRSLDRGAVAHASSHATAAALLEHSPHADVRVVHLGAMPLPAPTPTCPIAELDGRPYILAVATLERRKNLPRLVEAFADVAVEVPEVRLVIAGGDGDDRGAVDEAIDRLPPAIGSRVLLTGYVDDAVRSWLLGNARVLAYPSLDEGFGFPLLDAMQVDLPIVASNAGSIPEVAGAAALLSPADDVAALAANLVRALTDDAARATLVAAGRDQLAHFT